MGMPSLHEARPQSAEAVAAAPQRGLKVASFNIQTGISTSSFQEYITGGWRHFLPSTKRIPNLNRIAELLRPFDIVGLQEVEGGGARSHHIVQTEYLAKAGGFPHWHHQVNRRIGNIAVHSNGFLSRLQPDIIRDYDLPGLPGRGAIIAQFGARPREMLHVCVLHLALGRRARLRQLAFVSELIADLSHVILMGDLNCEPNSPELKLLTTATRLCDPVREIKTFPSWRPHKMLDHILVTPELEVSHLQVLNFACSDHLPIAMEIRLPHDSWVYRANDRSLDKG